MEAYGAYVVDWNVIPPADNPAFFSLSRDPEGDVNDLNSYCLSDTSIKDVGHDASGTPVIPDVLVPSEHRTLASAYGTETYVHYGSAPTVYDWPLNKGSYANDGFAPAFAAGLYALCLQVGGVTPEKFAGSLASAENTDWFGSVDPGTPPPNYPKDEVWALATVDPGYAPNMYERNLPYYQWVTTGQGQEAQKKEVNAIQGKVINPIGLLKRYIQPSS